MDRETALRIWNEVPGLANVVTGRSLEEFATRIEQLVREACANVCEEVANAPRTTKSGALAARECMGFIRMRSNADVTGLAPAQETTK